MAIMMASAGHQVTLWGHDPAHIKTLADARCNAQFLPHIDFPETLSVSDDLSQTVADHTFLMLAVPSHAFRQTLIKCQPSIQANTIITWLTKGFETDTGLLTHEVVNDVLGNNVPMALISGPSFALEVAQNLPTAVIVASPDIEVATHVADTLRTTSF